MHGRLRIAIVGYGTAGQAAALLLSAQGHALTVFEQAAEPGPVGAGFLLQPTGLGVLGRLGLAEAALARGQRIERLFGCNRAGRRVMDMRYADHAPDCFGLGLTRGSLFEVLRDGYADAAHIVTGTRIETLDESGTCLRDAAGSSYGPFDLIIAADGAHSCLRRTQPTIVRREMLYPWGALWCLLPAGDWPWPDTLQQRYAGTREMIGMLPVGQRVGHEGRWLTFYFSMHGDALADVDAAALTRLRERVHALWPEVTPLLDTIQRPDQLHGARYRDVVLRQPMHERVVFLGDAAHAMSPQLGQGVNMALLDAQALGDALSEASEVSQALAMYQATRRKHLAVYQRLSRWLTPWFQSGHESLTPVRDVVFEPLGRFALTRGHMLRILTGTKRSFWG